MALGAFSISKSWRIDGLSFPVPHSRGVPGSFREYGWSTFYVTELFLMSKWSPPSGKSQPWGEGRVSGIARQVPAKQGWRRGAESSLRGVNGASQSKSPLGRGNPVGKGMPRSGHCMCTAPEEEGSAGLEK